MEVSGTAVTIDSSGASEASGATEVTILEKADAPIQVAGLG